MITDIIREKSKSRFYTLCICAVSVASITSSFVFSAYQAHVAGETAYGVTTHDGSNFRLERVTMGDALVEQSKFLMGYLFSNYYSVSFRNLASREKALSAMTLSCAENVESKWSPYFLKLKSKLFEQEAILDKKSVSVKPTPDGYQVTATGTIVVHNGKDYDRFSIHVDFLAKRERTSFPDSPFGLKITKLTDKIENE